jgi:phosphate starvation-inducible PhoH-like protein
MTRRNEKPKYVKAEETQEIKPRGANINDILITKHRLKCKNLKQKEFANLISEKEIVLATGPAGVGKSYVAIARAIELLQNTSNQYQKITLINPAVEAEEKLGYLPGTVREKLDPFVGSSIDIVDKIVGVQNRIKLEEDGILSVGALGFIRGKTIDNTILVMEEAQNMSPNQMKTLLTRIGYNSKFIISGDLDQSDKYDDFRKSGLYDAVSRHKNIDEVGFIEFNVDEIVRNPLITKLLNNYKPNDTTLPKRQPKSTVIDENNLKIVQNKRKPKLFRKISIWFRKNFKW